MKVYAITFEAHGPAGHGEPPVNYLALQTNSPSGGYLGYGTPLPVYLSRAAAQNVIQNNRWNYYCSVTELEVSEN